MKTTSLSVLLGICVLAGSSASVFAKPPKDQKTAGTYGCARFDTNQDGILSEQEKAALIQAFEAGDVALQTLDINNNRKLDESEIAAIKLPTTAKKEKKKK